jgi:cystathionine beta-lyase/cystathionine gamma-synthase
VSVGLEHLEDIAGDIERAIAASGEAESGAPI